MRTLITKYHISAFKIVFHGVAVSESRVFGMGKDVRLWALLGCGNDGMDVRWMLDECGMYARWMWDECGMDVGWKWDECRMKVRWMWDECN